MIINSKKTDYRNKHIRICSSYAPWSSSNPPWGKMIGAKLMGMTPQIDQTGFIYI